MPSSFTLAFAPREGRVECSAFSIPFKGLAVVLVTLAVVWAWQLWSDGVLVMTWQSSGWLAAALLMMLLTQWHILRSKTSLDAVALEQQWVWHKRVELHDLAYAKLIQVRGFNWLIAPRLYTKTFSGRLTIFYAAEPNVLAEFERLESEVKALRTLSLT